MRDSSYVDSAFDASANEELMKYEYSLNFQGLAADGAGLQHQTMHCIRGGWSSCICRNFTVHIYMKEERGFSAGLGLYWKF